MVRSREVKRFERMTILVLALGFALLAACDRGGTEASATPTPGCLTSGVMATMEEFVAELEPEQQSTAFAQLTQSAPFVPAACPTEMIQTPTPPGVVAP